MPDLLDFDLFISYSRDDNRQGEISEIVAHIQNQYRDFAGAGEIRIFFDKREFGGMDDWRQNILDAIRSSRLLLVCLSPNYLQSGSCSWELNQYLRHKAAHAPVAENIVYFVEIPACSDKGFEQHRMLGIFLHFSASTGREHPFLQMATRNYAALLAELGRDSGQILARLNNLTRRFGISLGSDALCEIAMESQERRLPRSTAAIT